MGSFDIYGVNASSNKGKRFPLNFYQHKPFIDYILTIGKDLFTQINNFCYEPNNGFGLNSEGCNELATILAEEVNSGRTKDYADSFMKKQGKIKGSICKECKGEGRTPLPQEFIKHGVEECETPPVRRDCPTCRGRKRNYPISREYDFSEAIIIHFTAWLPHSGGFMVL